MDAQRSRDTDRPSDFESEIDDAFVAALRYFMEKERLSIQEFCRRTKKLSDTGDRMLILPTQLTKWRKDMMPSARAAMVTARVFGVSRSFFYLVGENIVQGKKPPPVEDDYLTISRLAMVRDALKTVDETHRLLRGLEETIEPRTDAEEVEADGGEDAPPPPDGLASSRRGDRVDRRVATPRA